MATSSPASLPREVLPAVRAAITGSALLAALVVAAKSLRDALLCATIGTADLPFVMASGAVTTALLALGAARMFRKRGPRFGVIALLALNAVALVAEHVTLEAAARSTALLLYFHVSAVTAVLVSGFWLVVNERFDPHTLRLIVARIGLGGSVGALSGGVIVAMVARESSPRRALLVLAVLSAALAFVIWKLATKRAASDGPSLRSNTETRASYVRLLALLVALTALTSSLADFALKSRALEHFVTAESLVRFFAVFYGAVNLVGFVVQSTLTPRLLQKADLGIALGGLPVAVGLSGLLALAVPGLATQALLRGADAALGVSLFRSAYEPLFTPLSVRAKRSVKALIDVVVDKAGDASGGALAWALVLLAPGAAAKSASLAVFLLSLLTLVVTARLYRRYVTELAASLRTGSVVLSEADVCDRTTRLTLSRTLDSMARERLVAEIQRRASQPPDAPSPARPTNPAATEPSSKERDRAPRHERELAAEVRDLCSGELERVARVLAEPRLELTPFVIPLLERPELAERAMAALASLGPRVSGQLADALLDVEHSSPTLRRRLVRVLAQDRSARSAAGLLSALDDPDARVRAEIARGLEQLRRRGLALPVSTDSLLAATMRELERSDRDPDQTGEQHALRLLGLAFEPEAFRLAAKALGGHDEKLRGTALEYLENVVPEPVRSALLARLAPATQPKSKQVARELLAELERTLHG